MTPLFCVSVQLQLVPPHLQSILLHHCILIIIAGPLMNHTYYYWHVVHASVYLPGAVMSEVGVGGGEGVFIGRVGHPLLQPEQERVGVNDFMM